MKRAFALLFVASGIHSSMAQGGGDEGAEPVIHDDAGAVVKVNATEGQKDPTGSKTHLRIAGEGKKSEPSEEWSSCPEGMSELKGVGCVPNSNLPGSGHMIGPTSEEKIRAAESRAEEAEQLLAEYQAQYGGATGGVTGATGSETGGTGATGGEVFGDETGASGGETGPTESTSDPEFDAMWANKTPSKQYKDGKYMIMQHDVQREAYDWNGTYTGINTAKEPLPDGATKLPEPDKKCCRICHGCKDDDRDENGECIEPFQPCETVCDERCDMSQPPTVTTSAPATESLMDQVTFDASNVVITDEMKAEVAKTPISERVQKISQLLRAAAARRGRTQGSSNAEEEQENGSSTPEEEQQENSSSTPEDEANVEQNPETNADAQ